MNIQLGNLRSLTKLGESKKMLELENKLKELGYVYEDNCEKNKETSKKTYHIYDIPKLIHFSVLDEETIEIIKSYGQYFNCRVGVAAELVNY